MGAHHDGGRGRIRTRWSPLWANLPAIVSVAGSLPSSPIVLGGALAPGRSSAIAGVSIAANKTKAAAVTRRGWPALLKAIARRTAKIYAFYMVTSAIIIISISAAATASPSDFTHQSFVALAGDPLSSLWSAALLTSPPALPGILVLYLMLTAIAIPLFLWLAQRDGRIALAVSAAVWVLAQFDPDLAPRFAERSYFDWLAWQFLFCVGMFIGLRRGMTSPFTRSLRSPAPPRGVGDRHREPRL